MTMAPQGTDVSTLSATQAECAECNAINPMEETVCEECGSDFLEYQHVTDHPLGFDDDKDFHIAAGFGKPERWVYIAANPG